MLACSPPWLVVGDGSCGDYADNEWLSDETLQTLKDWVDQGMIEGVEQERSLPGVRQLDAISQMISTPDFSPVREGSDFAEFDEYRCFPVEVNIDSPTYLTGYDVFPGNEAIVHHVIGNIIKMTGFVNLLIEDRLEVPSKSGSDLCIPSTRRSRRLPTERWPYRSTWL